MPSKNLVGSRCGLLISPSSVGNSHGAILATVAPIRRCLDIPSVPSGVSVGPTLLMSAALVSRCGILKAHAATYVPPPDMPPTANWSRPRLSAKAITSSGQSNSVRLGLGSERPYPGLSIVMMRASREVAIVWSG